MTQQRGGKRPPPTSGVARREFAACNIIPDKPRSSDALTRRSIGSNSARVEAPWRSHLNGLGLPGAFWPEPAVASTPITTSFHLAMRPGFRLKVGSFRSRRGRPTPLWPPWTGKESTWRLFH
jgi:hypothetical protein